METIAEHLGIKKFPFTIKDSNGNIIYYESPRGYWEKKEYDPAGNLIYFENSGGYIEDSRTEKIGNFKLKK